jgi:hypothetical protein
MEYLDNDYANIILTRNIKNDVIETVDKYLLIKFPILPENIEKMKAYYQNIKEILNTTIDECISKLDLPEEV